MGARRHLRQGIVAAPVPRRPRGRTAGRFVVVRRASGRECLAAKNACHEQPCVDVVPTRASAGGRSRRRRAHRGVPAAARLRRDAVRSRVTPRRSRAHPRRDHARRATPSRSTAGSSSTTSAPTRTCVRLFDELGVETQPSDMSMSVRCDGCGLEYAGARGPRRRVRPAVERGEPRASCACSSR